MATKFFFEREAAFAGGERIDEPILECVHGSVGNYVDVTLFRILRLSSKRTTAPCPGLETSLLQRKRVDDLFGY